MHMIRWPSLKLYRQARHGPLFTSVMRFGPTFEEMLDPALQPEAARQQTAAAHARGDELAPANLFRITWRPDGREVEHVVFPPELTGVDANIIVLCGWRFPTGSHKVGPAYSVLVEKQLDGDVTPGESCLVFPSTGNFGIGGAWVGPRMGYESLVVLPEEMSAERFEKITAYGADHIKTPGSESNVKEIFDKVRELRADSKNAILEQFSEMGNYRFHYKVTGDSALALVTDLAARGVGDGRIAAFVSAMGSAGTIAAADRIRQTFAEVCTVGLEPVQCPTLYNVGFGAHRIEGIGDKHVTWIHHVEAMDLLICVDDEDCLRLLQLVQEGSEHLVREAGVSEETAALLHDRFGVSGMCNVLGAIKAARRLGLRAGQNIVTIATDGFDRYPSVLRRLDAELGAMDRDEALRRIELPRRLAGNFILDGDRRVRRRWHNQKYFTWVEQQDKPLEQLQAQLDPAWWEAEQAKIADIDARILARRG